MTTINYFGRTVPCMEHISEIKEKSHLFNRFYNKKQMLKFYLGKFKFVEDGDEVNEDYDYVLETSDGFTPCGRRITVGRIDTDVTFVKFETLRDDESEIENVLSFLEWDSFFMKADDGQIYLVIVHED